MRGRGKECESVSVRRTAQASNLGPGLLPSAVKLSATGRLCGLSVRPDSAR